VSRRLIVNADDYGRTAGVSLGIRQAHLDGIVSTATVMVNLPDAAPAIAQARRETPELGLGVHLTLTFGRPVSPPASVPSLVTREGRFHSLDALLSDPAYLDRADVEREWQAQIDRLLETRCPLDHLDSHHHIALLRPDLWDLYLDLAARHDVGVRPGWPSDSQANSMTTMLPGPMREFACQRSGERLRASGVPHPDHFFAAFYAETAALDDLQSLLAGLPQGVSEIMTHPGHADAALRSSSGYAVERQEELATLTDPSLADALHRERILLTTYRQAWIAS
jgi:predicted glycoside hydrolase/deacetylase ChbG (UPF0249 family)